MTESEGYNFSTGLNKYPSRFLFEINENFFVRKGELSQEVIDEAKEQLKLESDRQNIFQRFNKGDNIIHPIWNQGKVIDVNPDKGEYQIEFFDSKKIKPISFEYKGLSLVENPTIEIEEYKTGTKTSALSKEKTPKELPKKNDTFRPKADDDNDIWSMLRKWLS